MSNGPAYRIVAKPKDKEAAKDRANTLDLFAVFEGRYGFNLSPAKPYKGRPSVACIIVVNDRGEETRISPVDYWLNMEAPRQGGRRDDDSSPPF